MVTKLETGLFFRAHERLVLSFSRDSTATDMIILQSMMHCSQLKRQILDKVVQMSSTLNMLDWKIKQYPY